MDVQQRITPAVEATLIAAGWGLNKDGEWRKFNDAGEEFSPVAGDHDRIFPAALEAAEKAVAADEVEDHGDDQLRSKSVANADADIVTKAKKLFAADATKTGFAKTWDEASQGMRDHFIRQASQPQQ